MESGSNLLRQSIQSATFDFGLRLFGRFCDTRFRGVGPGARRRRRARGALPSDPSLRGGRSVCCSLLWFLRPPRPALPYIVGFEARRRQLGGSALARLRGLSVLSEFDVKLNGQDARFEVEFARFGIRVDLCLCAAAETASREALQTPFPTHLQPWSSKRAAALRRRRGTAAPSTDQ